MIKSQTKGFGVPHTEQLILTTIPDISMFSIESALISRNTRAQASIAKPSLQRTIAQIENGHTTLEGIEREVRIAW